GMSIIETLVTIAIISVLVGLLMPAVQAVRRSALEMTCKNNLRQVNLAIAQYYDARNRLPHGGTSGRIGGRTNEGVPYLDQGNLYDRIKLGTPIAAAPDFLLLQPSVMRCPIHFALDEPAAGAMESSSYVMLRNGDRSYSVADSPLDLHVPWASGPEIR